MALRDELCAKMEDGYLSAVALRDLITREAGQRYFEALLKDEPLDQGNRAQEMTASFVPRARKLLAILVYLQLDRYAKSLEDPDDEIFPVREESAISVSKDDLHLIMKAQWKIAPFWKANSHLMCPDVDSSGHQEFQDLYKGLLFIQFGDRETDISTYGQVKFCTMREGHLLDHPPHQVSHLDIVREDS